MYLNLKTGEITNIKQGKKLFGAKEINEIIKSRTIISPSR